MVGFHVQIYSLREKEKKGENSHKACIGTLSCGRSPPIYRHFDGYYVAYKPITLSRILFMFIEMIFIYFHSCVMFAMTSMSMRND